MDGGIGQTPMGHYCIGWYGMETLLAGGSMQVGRTSKIDGSAGRAASRDCTRNRADRIIIYNLAGNHTRLADQPEEKCRR